MTIRTHYHFEHNHYEHKAPLKDAKDQPLITDYIGPITLGAKLKFNDAEYEARDEVLELDADGASLRHVVTLRAVKLSFVVDWSDDRKFAVAGLLFMCTVALCALPYLTYKFAPVFALVESKTEFRETRRRSCQVCHGKK